MTDEIVIDEQTESEQQGTGTDQTKTEKTFSQDDVNRLIAKEKSTWKRQHDKDKEIWSDAEETLRKQVTDLGEAIQSQVDTLKKDLELDDLTLELLNEKSPLEQYRFILKKMEKSAKTDIPRTPRGEGNLPPAQPFKRTNSV